MPATFPSHAAVVLPLKFWKPRWFDGIALTVGSAAPDVSYALDGTWLEWPVHSLPPTWAIAHSWVGIVIWGLPVTLLGCWIIRWAFMFQRPALLITMTSALIGAGSHVLWDRLAVNPVADLASSIVGAVVTIALLWVHYGRRSLTAAMRLRARVSWPVLAIGIAALPFLPGARLPHTTGVRILLVIALSVVVQQVRRRRAH